MIHQTQFYRPESKVRAALAESLCLAIAQCHPDDAAQIMAAALDDMSAGMPDLAIFSDMRADAEFWADAATPIEVEAYFVAALRRLGGMAHGLAARKRLLVSLWQSLPVPDRRAFLSRVDAAGRFHGGKANAA